MSNDFFSSAGYLEKVPSISQVKEVHCVSGISRLWYSKEMSLTRLTEAGRFISTSQAFMKEDKERERLPDLKCRGGREGWDAMRSTHRACPSLVQCRVHSSHRREWVEDENRKG